jgi:hypothetical protein
MPHHDGYDADLEDVAPQWRDGWRAMTTPRQLQRCDNNDNGYNGYGNDDGYGYDYSVYGNDNNYEGTVARGPVDLVGMVMASSTSGNNGSRTPSIIGHHQQCHFVFFCFLDL